MAISFNEIPANLRVPLCYIEFDNSNAVQGLAEAEYQLLVLGQMLPAGLADEAKPVRVLSADHAVSLFGRGSMLSAMFAAIKGADKWLETWAIPLADAAAGVAATGTVTLTGTATAAGVLNCYIAGQRVRAAVAAADTAAEAAAALGAAVNEAPDLPVTAVVADAVVTLTARHKGLCGNDIDVRMNYYTGETLPAGLTVAVAAMAGGEANPEIADAIDAMGDEWWNALVVPWTDGANMAALEAELLERWGPMSMQDSQAFAAVRGTHAEASTWSASRNSHLVSCMPTGPAPTPAYVWAAVYATIAAVALADDPARPLQTLALPGILAPAKETRWTKEERNLLLYDGLSSYVVDRDGTVRIERAVTTYQTNAYGLEDVSYLDVTTPATLSYIRYVTRVRITTKFPRHKLADDGTRFGPGQAIATPSIVRAELLALFRELEERGLVEGFEQFKAELIVERNADDPNRLDVLAPPNIVNQLRVFAEQIQFIL
jgi:phage tail sheath gpL-like